MAPQEETAIHAAGTHLRGIGQKAQNGPGLFHNMVLTIDGIGDEQFRALASGLDGTLALFSRQLNHCAGQRHQNRKPDENEAPEQAVVVEPPQRRASWAHACLCSGKR
ncbi:hypothetical protein VB618_12155 [Microvirga sp. CF3062]|uniref:hypothetical protein n=1 Tax=Microvirga sp. CF3062 TaxID=3110182 RepID=UPI002E75A2A7|nr:hypothetical protein [Microvirga sp. CF3062]MEE1656953.1 hypothetical protein [Microvirga sp. CF3062]